MKHSSPHRHDSTADQAPTAIWSNAPALHYAVKLIHRVCCLAGSANLINEFSDHKLAAAIEARDTPALFDWLQSGLSYQGISDEIAEGYMERNGQATWQDLTANLSLSPTCPKLASYWQFYGCRYQKAKRTCAEPAHLDRCPLPTHRLRNGRLNQLAYSLFLFIRDVADRDLIGWIDNQLATADDPNSPDRISRMPLRHVYAVADKVLMMALSSVLIAGGNSRPRWLEVGAAMIAVDTLVHNFLHRTGILARFGADHACGRKLLSAWPVRRHHSRCRRPDRRPCFQPGVPAAVCAVRAVRDLAILRSVRPERLQRQSHR